MTSCEPGSGAKASIRSTGPLTLLSLACPDRHWEELARLDVGERDSLLWSLRERTLGCRLDGLSACPTCGEQLEFSLDSGTLHPAGAAESSPVRGRLEVGEVTIVYRLPNSVDLAAVAGCSDAAAGRDLLVQRCVLCARQGEAEIDAESLPETVIQALSDHMAACHPAAEVLLDLDCPACGRRWPVLLDIASFFWVEVEAAARRLAREVHALARAYGWREADILDMSSRRRELYLQMVSA